MALDPTAPPALQATLPLLIALTLIFSSLLLFSHRRRAATAPVPAPMVTVRTAKVAREPGEWVPDTDFAYPLIEACEQELVDVRPIAYRPFRWGDYHITMGIRSMPWESWIELDDQFAAYHRIRADRIRTRGDKVIRVLPNTPGRVKGGAEGALELVHEVAEYLCRRYPTTFRVERHTDVGRNGTPRIKSVTIVPLGETYAVPLDAGEERAAERAMEVAALLVQDDLAIMVEGTDGKYYFQAGAICVAGFWRLQDKIGMSLDEIHVSGDVPRYQEKLEMSMERFFVKLAVDKPVVRNNYFVQVVPEGGDSGEELAWSTLTLGPEDAYRHDRARSKRGVRAEGLRLRTERQTLRRLPLSGAIVFTIRTYMVRVDEIRGEEGRRLASAVVSWPEDVGSYKGRDVFLKELLEMTE